MPKAGKFKAEAKIEMKEAVSEESTSTLFTEDELLGKSTTLLKKVEIKTPSGRKHFYLLPFGYEDGLQFMDVQATIRGSNPSALMKNEEVKALIGKSIVDSGGNRIIKDENLHLVGEMLGSAAFSIVNDLNSMLNIGVDDNELISRVLEQLDDKGSKSDVESAEAPKAPQPKKPK